MKAGGGQGSGELLGDDAVPETLEPILRRQMQEQLPAIKATSALYKDWAANAASGDRVPRALGDITIDIEGHSGPAKARSFPLWRLQAALDVYDTMSPEDRTRADTLLERVGGNDLKTFRLPARLKREKCQVVLA